MLEITIMVRNSGPRYKEIDEIRCDTSDAAS